MKKTIEKFRRKFEPKKDSLETKIEDAKKISNPAIRKVKVDKLEKQLKELEQSYYPEQRERVKLWKDLHHMDLDAFYNSLPRDWKINLIRERITVDNFCVADSTEAQTLLSMSDASEGDLKLDDADLNLIYDPNEINIQINLRAYDRMLIDEGRKGCRTIKYYILKILK